MRVVAIRDTRRWRRPDRTFQGSVVSGNAGLTKFSKITTRKEESQGELVKGSAMR
jgi:hypothetical protein